MMSATGTSKAGPGSVRGAKSALNSIRGVTKGTPKSRERYELSSPQTRRPRTKWGTRIFATIWGVAGAEAPTLSAVVFVVAFEVVVMAVSPQSSMKPRTYASIVPAQVILSPSGRSE
ncbi:hypothetical protein SAMN02787118_12189 [Streptomyces mirabilis]|jgi:hypothetical protein|uniref:Uncharacterized protein n=1 Tax=Streptomyces mirabilis TaxID=68239 RepID=A0A1I2S8I5_9ACTN|nr:hypothetical protein SAMN02787118_12189 [Streptomyces mirabilis]